MINKINADRIDEVVDSFEESWSLDSRSQIPSLLKRFGLANDSAAATELMRVDIELRYSRGISIRLEDYLDEFGELLVQPRFITDIAFEDYRSREAYGHPVSSSRWRSIPGIDNEGWFRQLSRQTEIVPARPAKEVDGLFEAALEEIGFHLIHELGRGAFSQVFLATQNDLADRYVVLKVIDKALSEPQNMAMLQHTNIVPIYSFERILSRSVICMPYAGRVTLADFLKGESQASSRGGQSLIATVLNHVHDTVTDSDELPQGVQPAIPAADDNAVLRPLERLRSLSCNELAMWLFQRLAAALAHSHARGVLHGDLKPANVLIRNDGEPALLDFNLSQTLDHEHLKHAGGTLPYMSPEMLRGLMGQPVKPHAASDIYSMGVMLYQFVTGRMPFPSPPCSAAIDVEYAIAARQQPITWHPADDVVPGCRSIIEKCLEFDPADRYESAEQLQKDLDRELKDEPLITANEPTSARVRKWIRRHPSAVSNSVAVLLAVLMIPLVLWSITWRNRSAHLAAIATLDAFADRSSEVLSTVMVDPLRYENDAITRSMVPLEDFGIFADDALTALDAPLLTATQRSAYRKMIFRHIAQLAFHELARLRTALERNDDGRLSAKELERADRLLAAASRYQSQSESRAFTFLAAERAWLDDDQQAFDALTAHATQMSIDSDDNEKYLEAVRLMTHRRWPQASELLTSLADRESIPSADRWTLLGRSQFHEGLYEQAKIAYTQSIERAPASSRLHLLRGQCYFQLRKYRYAEEDFSKSIELEPKFVSAWIERGVSRMAQQRFDEAVEDFSSGLKYSPGHIHLLLMRSRAYDRLGKREDAKRDFDEAMKSEKYTVTSLVRRATARRIHGDYEGALADLEKAHELDPRSLPVLKGKARIYAGHMDRLEDAIELLAKVEELEPTNETVIIDRAVYHARIGQFEQAKNALRKAIAPPNLPRTLYQAACVNALLPEPERRGRALGFLSRAIQQGYGADEIANDSDLDSLRELDGFKAILKTVRMGHKVRPKVRRPESELPELDTLPSSDRAP